MTNLAIIERICTILDEAFARRSDLGRRFGDAPAAQRRQCASLKTHIVDRKGHDRRYAIDESKIREELGYIPTFNLERSLRETVEWYVDNEKWWRSVMDGSYRQWLEKNYAE